MSDSPLDAFHRHQVLHTASIVSSMFDDFLLDHAYTKSDPELAAAAERVSEALAGFYLLVGRKTMEPSLDDPDNPEWTDEDFARAERVPEGMTLQEFLDQLRRRSTRSATTGSDENR